MQFAPPLEEQAIALGGYCEYLSIPESANPDVLLNNTALAIWRDSHIVVHRRLQNRNGRLTDRWRDNPSTLLIRKRSPAESSWVTASEVSLLDSEPVLSLEDARVLQFDDQARRLIVAVWEFSQSTRTGAHRAVTSQAVVSLGQDFGIQSLELPNIGHNLSPTLYEKNWMPIPNSEHVTYSLDGLHTVRALWGPESFTSPGLAWEFGEIHGGTQWTRQGENMMGIFHSSRPIDGSEWRGIRHNKKYFVLGAVLAKAHPPYRIVAYTPEPLFWSSPRNPRVDNGSILLFANGFAVDGSRALLTMGVNDAASALVSFPLEAVYGRLRAI